MYAFQPRVPLDHILAFVQIVRGEERKLSEALKLIGAITGEIGALLGDNFTAQCDVIDAPSTVDGCLLSLESILSPSVQADPNFDPSPWIPIILKLIELWLSRRG